MLQSMVRPLVGALARALTETVGDPDGAYRAMFSAGEQGFWYDPSDFSTMFQDSAGTTAAAVNQPVGLIRDKSGNGNHAAQATPDSRPILRGTPTGASVVVNGTFDTDTGWNKGTGWSIAGGVATALNPLNSSQYLSQSVADFTPGVYRVTYTVSRYVAGTVRPVSIGTATSAGVSRTAAGTYTDWITLDSGSGGDIRFQPVTGTDCDFDIDNVDVRLASADAVQAPYFLAHDGVNDFLATAAIDFTGTDKMTVIAGVRKQADASTATVVELGTNVQAVDGSFAMWLPHDPSNEASFVGRGTITKYAIYNDASAAAPVSLVATGTADLAGDSVVLRVDGAQVASSPTDLGLGNFGNHALYIGRGGGGTSRPLNGDLYQLVGRGASSTASELSRAEARTAVKTGVTF